MVRAPDGLTVQWGKWTDVLQLQYSVACAWKVQSEFYGRQKQSNLLCLKDSAIPSPKRQHELSPVQVIGNAAQVQDFLFKLGLPFLFKIIPIQTTTA